jgi:hypothetical protein
MFSDTIHRATPIVVDVYRGLRRCKASSAALLALSWVASPARAQVADSVATLSVEQYPGAPSDGLPGEIELRVLRASVGAPIPISDATTLVLGAAYERLDIGVDTGGELELHAPKLTLGALHDFSERWGLMAFADVGLAGSFEDGVGSDDLLLSLTGIATYAVSDELDIGAGVLYDRRSGDLAPMPALLVQLRLSERLRVRGFAPVWLRAEYRATPWLDVGIRSTFESNRFHVIDETSPERDTELAYTNLTVGPQVTFNITDWTHLDLYAAGAVYRRYELFEHDESFARQGLSPVIGYGARLWIAPSNW